MRVNERMKAAYRTHKSQAESTSFKFRAKDNGLRKMITPMKYISEKEEYGLKEGAE